MTVQELFTCVDVEDVLHAYLLIDYHFSKDNDRQTLRQKVEAVNGLREIIINNVNDFKTCTPAEEEHRETLFIMEIPGREYGEDDLKELTGFVVYDDQIEHNLEKDFHLFGDDGELRIEHYGFDMMMVEELAACRIAKESIYKLGAAICASYILSEIFFFGFDKDEREQYINEIYADLDKANQEIENGECVSAEELFEEMKKDLYKDETEDEFQYRQAKEEFDQKVQDIETRYRKKVTEEIHKQYVDAIRKEYKDRILE